MATDDGGLAALFPDSDTDQDDQQPAGDVTFVAGDGGAQPEHNHFDLRSVNRRLTIRHQPSQGLSFQLWPAAAALTALLDGHQLDQILPRRRPLRILELGSGTGLAGLAAAAALGAHVTLSDLPHVVPNLSFNVELNSAAVAAAGGHADVRALRWGCPEDVEGLKFDLVMASDVVYHDHLYQPLLDTLAWLLISPAAAAAADGGSGSGGFLMAHLRRWKKESVFFSKARKLFKVTVVHTDPPADGARRGVVVYHFVAKGGHC